MDPVGLGGGLNTYTYADTNPLSNFDPSGLRCLGGIGCWTTPQEASLANNGNYMGYYKLACAGGDAYACFAQHIAADNNFWGHMANWWLNRALRNHAEKTRQCLNKSAIKDQIRKDLAWDYANYLPNSEDQARWPTVQGVEQFHWGEFAKFGLAPSTFGGTPFGSGVGPVIPEAWCPNCSQ